VQVVGTVGWVEIHRLSVEIQEDLAEGAQLTVPLWGQVGQGTHLQPHLVKEMLVPMDPLIMPHGEVVVVVAELVEPAL